MAFRKLINNCANLCFRQYATARPQHLLDCTVMPHLECWNCQKALDCHRERFFCSDCERIQPPVKCINYFQYLDFPVSYAVNTEQLGVTYRSLQRLLHPDRFTTKSETERNFAEEQASIVNKAYATLLKPFPRALYLLRLHGRPIAETDGVKMDPEFLMEVMEQNEEVAATDNRDMLLKIQKKNAQLLQECTNQISEAFAAQRVDEARTAAAKAQYYMNIEEKLNDKLGLG